MSVHYEYMAAPASDLADVIRYHTAHCQEWRVAVRTPVHDSVTDGRTGRYQTADLNPGWEA